MKHYELTYLVSAKLDEENVIQINEKINTFLQDKNAILGLTERPKKITLSYPIQKQEIAWLVSNDFYLEPHIIKDLENTIKSNKEIIRYIIISKPEAKIANRTQEKEGDIKPQSKKEKISLEEIDKKLEEIL